MAEKIKLWNRLFWGAFAGLLSAVLAFLGLTKASEAYHPYGDSPAQKIGIGFRRPLAGNFHMLELMDDTDGDGINDQEEEDLHIGSIHFNPLDPNQNDNKLPDGTDLATQFANRIEMLPGWDESGTQPLGIYRKEYQAYGEETCQVCGKFINMGFCRILNTQHGLNLDIPYIALHYMKEGCFSFDGSDHQGRVNLALLRVVMEDSHQQQVPGDSDGDFVRDDEEMDMGLDPVNPDENRDFRLDGSQLANEMFVAIEDLPLGPQGDMTYKIEHITYGLENCGTCGEVVNMGHIEIVNPQKSLSVEIHFIAVHALKHGSFDYDGDINSGRIPVPLLAQILDFDES